MDDPFLDDSQATAQFASRENVDETMSRAIESNSQTMPLPAPSPAKTPRSEERGNLRALRETLAAKHICPFCGSANPAPAAGSSGGPCPRCTMEDSAATRQATKARIGPWHVLQTRNPAAPGMRYATLLALIAKGQVTARSIVRGPTSHQLWRWAGHVRGLSREFGMCYSCGQAIERTVTHCPNCDRSQEPPANPDALLESKEVRAANGAPVSSGSGTLALTEDLLTPDPYAVRSGSITPAASHTDRLRISDNYRPVDARIEARPDLPGAPRRRNDGRILSSMELAAALQVAPPELPANESHPVRTTLLTVAVVGVLATLIVGYTRPDLRQQAVNWAQQTWQPVEKKLTNIAQKPASDSPPGNSPVNQPSDVATDSVNGQSQSASSTLPPASLPPTAQQSNVATGSTPAAVTPTVTDVTPTTPPVDVKPAQNDSTVTQPQANPPAPISPAPGTTPGNMATADTTDHPSLLQPHATLQGSDSTAKQIWAIRNQALDAEGRDDWATAVKLYEQIETAPPEMWPADTKIHLATARRQLATR